MLNIPSTVKKRVVIVGGGFAGLTLANRLDQSLFQVVLIDRNNYHQFQPLLYQVASSGLEPSSICFPFRKLFHRLSGLYVRLAEVTRIDTDRRRVETSVGSVGYDYLVIAAGTTTNFFGNRRMAESALPMKTVEEAMLVRNRILMNLEKAAVEPDPSERAKLLRIIVVGAGATGVEVAGVLSEMKRYVIPRDFPDLNGDNISIHLIEGSDRVLSAMSAEASEAAFGFLHGMGVDIRLHRRVEDYVDDEVVLDDGSRLEAKTVIWVSGVCANRVEGIAADVIGRGGRIEVDGSLQVKGLAGVFVVGDMALMTQQEEYPGGHPQVAQVAIQQARLLADNLKRKETGGQVLPFRYVNLGSMATIGRNKAVADLGRLHLKGFVAWVLWMTIHLRSILGVKNKISVLMDWVWNYFSYHRSIRLILFRGRRE